MSESWVTVAEYANNVAADLAKAELDLEDIECQLSGDQSHQVMPVEGISIKLLVRETDLEHARQVLADREIAQEDELA